MALIPKVVTSLVTYDITLQDVLGPGNSRVIIPAGAVALDLETLASPGALSKSIMLANLAANTSILTVVSSFDPLALGGLHFIAPIVTPGSSSTTYAWANTGATEAAVEYPMPRAGTIKALNVSPSAATAGGSSTSFTLRKNGGATTLTVTVGAAISSTVVDNTHSVSFQEGDQVDLVCITNGTAPVATFLCSVAIA